MQAVVITGSKKSGKTTILSLVAEALERRGKRVAVVKYSTHALDKGNEDAFWLMRPGRAVVNVSSDETAVFWPRRLLFAELAAHLDADVALLEGGDAPDSVPRIFCFKEDEGADKACLACETGAYAVIATVGSACPGSEAPFFAEMDPVAAEKITALILEKAPHV